MVLWKGGRRNWSRQIVFDATFIYIVMNTFRSVTSTTALLLNLHFEGMDLFLVLSLDIEVWFVLKFERPWCGIAVLWASGCIVRTEELWVGSHEWGRIFVSPALGAGKKKEEGHGVLLSLD